MICYNFFLNLFTKTLISNYFSYKKKFVFFLKNRLTRYEIYPRTISESFFFIPNTFNYISLHYVLTFTNHYKNTAPLPIQRKIIEVLFFVKNNILRNHNFHLQTNKKKVFRIIWSICWWQSIVVSVFFLNFPCSLCNKHWIIKKI